MLPSSVTNGNYSATEFKEHQAKSCTRTIITDERLHQKRQLASRMPVSLLQGSVQDNGKSAVKSQRDNRRLDDAFDGADATGIFKVAVIF